MITDVRTIVNRDGRRAAWRSPAHATTDEGMRRAVLAGVDTNEHGYEGTDATFQMMAARTTPDGPRSANTNPR